MKTLCDFCRCNIFDIFEFSVAFVLDCGHQKRVV